MKNIYDKDNSGSAGIFLSLVGSSLLKDKNGRSGTNGAGWYWTAPMAGDTGHDRGAAITLEWNECSFIAKFMADRLFAWDLLGVLSSSLLVVASYV